jgi:hypothetical protein
MVRALAIVLLVAAGCGDDSGKPIDAAVVDAYAETDVIEADARPVPDARIDGAIIPDAAPEADASAAVVATCTTVCTAVAACAIVAFDTCYTGCTGSVGDCSSSDLDTIAACSSQSCDGTPPAIVACIQAVACYH